MPAAYTLYKFKKMFGLVLLIFFILIILSIINPIKSRVTKEVVSEVDESGAGVTALAAYGVIDDPEAPIKQGAGNFLYRLMRDNPKGFFVLALIVTIILFGGGIYLRNVRGFQRSLFR